MTLAFCVDDRGGLSFNRRRQSRDRAVSATALPGRGMHPLGGALLPPLVPPGGRTHPHGGGALDPGGPEDVCFLELTGPAPALERADQLILYRWNRHYPSDRKIALPPEGWT